MLRALAAADVKRFGALRGQGDFFASKARDSAHKLWRTAADMRMGDSRGQGCRVPMVKHRRVKSAIDELIENAAVHAAEFAGPRAAIPSKHIAIVTCMDSRIDSFRIFGLEPGEAHILRNAGGLVSDDVLRSLVLSQRLLQTREVMLMLHTNCGLHGTDETALRDAIVAETGASPDYDFGAFSDLDATVRIAVARVRAHEFLPHRDRVRGFVYHTESGDVREIVE